MVSKQNKLKLVGYFVVAILILNLLLFAFGIVNWMVLWGVIAIGAIFVWKVLPWLKKLK